MSDTITDVLAENVTLTDVLKATWGTMSDDFKSRVPSGLLDEDLANFGKALSTYEVGANEFMYGLINQIGMIKANAISFNNPLKMFKKGMLEYGDTIEEIYVEPIKALLYESEVPNGNGGDQWETFKPSVDVQFYKVNKEYVYPLTINRNMIRRAFRSLKELDKFLSSCILQMTNGDEIDDFDLTMQLIEAHVDEFYKVQVDEVKDETSARKLVMGVRALVPTLKFPSRKFNPKGVLNWTSADKLYLLVTPQTQAVLDVEVLSRAFNMDKVTFMGHVVEVPNLPKGIQAIMLDEDSLVIYDTLIQMANTGLNARHLTENYFYHHQGLFAMSPYYTAIAFTTDEVTTATSITITGADSITKAKKGIVSETYSADQSVAWSIVDNPQYVSIDQNGKLSVGAKCEATSVTLKATLTADESVTATKEITIA